MRFMPLPEHVIRMYCRGTQAKSVSVFDNRSVLEPCWPRASVGTAEPPVAPTHKTHQATMINVHVE